MRQSNALSQAYREIAERHLLAARLVAEGGLWEIVAFHAYHAFESVCCSALAQARIEIPRVHTRKIEVFQHEFQAYGFQADFLALSARLALVRNMSLYPSSIPDVVAPSELLLDEDVARLLVDVATIVNVLVNDLKL